MEQQLYKTCLNLIKRINVIQFFKYDIYRVPPKNVYTLKDVFYSINTYIIMKTMFFLYV